VERRGVSIALASRAFGVSETCYRYSPKLKAENEAIADLLTGLCGYLHVGLHTGCNRDVLAMSPDRRVRAYF
jgi:hypothetical protein